MQVDDPNMPLLYALRNELALHGPRFGCGLAQCGACTVHIDGQANPTVHAALDQLQALGAHGGSAFVILERSIVQQAYMLATSDLFWVWGWSYVVLVAVVWLARPPFSAAGAHSAGE